MSPENVQEIEAWSKLVSAASQVLWPVAVMTLVLFFKGDLSSLLRRLKRGKLFGQEVELNSEIVALERSTEEAVSEVQLVPQLIPLAPVILEGEAGEAALKRLNRHISNQEEVAEEERVLRLAAADAAVGIMKLGSLLEKELRLLTIAAGLDAGEFNTAQRMISALHKNEKIPRHLLGSLKMFWDVRAKVVHGQEANTNELRVIDTGLTLLRTVRSIRRALSDSKVNQ